MTPARRRSLLVGVLLGLAATFIALAVVRALDDDDQADAVLSEPGPAPEPGVATQAEVAGKRLPDATYQRLEGGEFRFADLQGRPVVANLWASWCGPCVAEMPDFQRVYEDVGDRVEFVGVNHTDQQDAAREFAARSGVTYRLVRDPRGTFASELELVGMPTTVFADADGVVVAAYPGVLTADELRAEIDRLFPA